MEIPLADDYRWLNLINFILKDLSEKPLEINKVAIILVPVMGIFAALSWLGVIATVPNGVKEKLHLGPFWQYALMIIAGIPLIEIGLSMGGTFGLNLSRLGNKSYSLAATVMPTPARWTGYLLITLFGLVSFATNATLTIQEFKFIPWLAWLLLPSSTLGIDLINIASGIELWNKSLVAASAKIGKNEALWLEYVNFIGDMADGLQEVSLEDIALLIFALDREIQKKLMSLLPCIQDKNLEEYIQSLAGALQAKLTQQKLSQSRTQVEITQLLRWMRTDTTLVAQPCVELVEVASFQ